MKEIYEIEFPNLKSITFYENDIESIESLHRMHMPNLEELGLSTIPINEAHNKIICVTDLKKAHWPNLNIIYFCKHEDWS